MLVQHPETNLAFRPTTTMWMHEHSRYFFALALSDVNKVLSVELVEDSALPLFTWLKDNGHVPDVGAPCTAEVARG